MTDLQSFVQRRLKLSIVLLISAKVSACILQLISIPIAVKYLGVDGYATFVALFAISVAPQVFVLRHGPSLTGPIASLYASGRWSEMAIRLWSAVTASLLTLSASLITFIIVYFSGLVQIPIPEGRIQEGDVFATLIALTAMHLLMPLIIVFEDTQAALHETHLQGMRTTIGNVAAIFAIFVLLPKEPTLLVYATALVLPPLLVRIANVGIFLIRHRQLRFPGIAPSTSNFARAIKSGILFTAVVGIGSYASNQLPVIAAASFLTARETASVSVIQQLTLVTFAFGSVIVVGFLPAFNTSLADGNKSWVSLWLSKIDRLLLSLVLPCALLFVIIGNPLHTFLIGHELAIRSQAMFFAGIYAILAIIENFYFLLASSVGLVRKSSLLFIIRAVLTGVSAFICCAANVPHLFWLAATVLTLCITVLRYRSMVWKFVAADESKQALEISDLASSFLPNTRGTSR